MTDPQKTIETIQRKQIEEDVQCAAMRIWANQESYLLPHFALCTSCGEQRRCVSYVEDRRNECCECYIKRRIKERIELLPKPTKLKLDLEDFTRL